MGKSAQVPLHVWLPDSMEGPTPISALIHAATMVTAGIFMVARMSPLFEYSEPRCNFVLFIGATTALFMGLLGIINNDIKRVVAYSTLSQLGYMTVALGASAYGSAIFHLMTHAFFKALLFLAAGSVIIGMHHEQDMRKMGGLASTCPSPRSRRWIGTLALIGTPLFSGYYSKDLIIDATHQHRAPAPVAAYAYWCVLIGVFVTAFYSFRLLFMTFHGKPRFARAPRMLHGHGAWDQARHARSCVATTITATAITVSAARKPLGRHGSARSCWRFRRSPSAASPSGRCCLATASATHLLLEHHDVNRRDRRGVPRLASAFALHALQNPVFWLCAACSACLGALRQVAAPAGRIDSKLRAAARRAREQVLLRLVQRDVLAAGSRLLGKIFWKVGDQAIIDKISVDGSAPVGFIAGIVRRVQSGFLYSYAFWMVIGLAVMLGWFLTRA